MPSHRALPIEPPTVRPAAPLRSTPPGSAPDSNMVWIPGGTFVMGSNSHYPEERPAHTVTVDGFWMDRTPVTNEQFERFVAVTGHVTFAEYAPNPADYPGAAPDNLYAGSLVFVKPAHRVSLSDLSNWWQFMRGADWRHPLGPRSSLHGLSAHPVVHVAYRDAETFARWEGKELPTEAEWERAARGGLQDATFAWGEELMPNGRPMANTWQGRFPYENTLVDGWERTSPVGSFPPNGFGLYDMVGNVWEWTSDWYAPRHNADEPKACCVPHNPRGGTVADSLDPALPGIQIPRKVLKGGSHLCSPNYCQRYRPAARQPQPIDTSTSHVGFRCIVRPSR